METKISVKKYGTTDNAGDSGHLVSFIKVTPTVVGISTNTPYLVIKNLEDLTFETNYLESKVSGYTSIDLDTAGSDSISFSTTNEVSFENLPIFISPGLSYLELGATPTEVEEKGLGVMMIILIIVLVLLFGGGVYLGLKIWYKKKYEKHLFKNQNNLYNLIVYIENSKKRGLSEDTIRGNLQKSSWTSEQINYVLKRHAGKKVGLNLFSKEKSKVINNIADKKPRGMIPLRRPMNGSRPFPGRDPRRNLRRK